jgi:phage terminase large subunit
MPLIDKKFCSLKLPEKHARVLFDNSKKWRYRVLHGGRNGFKDWSMTAACAEIGVRTSKRFLFTREIQNTIKDSAHRLIGDMIKRLGYADYFEITKSEIKCKINETIFLFHGLNDLVSEDIKSMEGIDICVIGEAQDLTKKSFVDLDPTIRKPGSEIWIAFNDQFDDDFVYDFCVTNPPENMIADKVLYTDGPSEWVSQEIKDQSERMRREDSALYENVWLGKPLGQGGRIYPMYDPAIHEIEFNLEYLKECDLYMSIDPHRKYYPAIVWYAVTPTNSIVVYNEWPRYEDLGMWYDEARNVKDYTLSLEELANVILANDMIVQYGGRIVQRTGDPRFLGENPDIVRTLMSKGVLGWVDAPFERIETQRENLKSLIRYNPAIPLAGTNLPDWYVKKECRNVGRSLRRAMWDTDKDKESETCKDFNDAHRYWLSLFPEGKPTFTERGLSQNMGKPKSLSELQMSGRPAQGYFEVVK